MIKKEEINIDNIESLINSLDRMFNLTRLSTIPVTAPVASPLRYNSNYIAFRANNTLGNTMETAFLWLMMAELECLKIMKSSNWASCSLVGVGAGANNGDLTEAEVLTDLNSKTGFRGLAIAILNDGTATILRKQAAAAALSYLSKHVDPNDPIAADDQAFGAYIALKQTRFLSHVTIGTTLINFPAEDNIPQQGNIDANSLDTTLVPVCKELFNTNQVVKYLTEMVASQQVRDLTDANVQNYLRSAKIDIGIDRVKALVKHAATVLDRFTATVGFAALRQASKWVQYHTNATSTPVLCQRFLDSLPPTYANLVSAQERQLVADAVANQHDRAATDTIPIRVVAIVCAYNEACDTRFGQGRWYQGDSARNSIPTAQFQKYVAFFRKMNEIQSRSQAIAGAADLAALLAEW